MSDRCVSVGVPVPGLGRLTYRVPAGLPTPVRGARVRVPLGTRQVIGCVIDAAPTAVDVSTLKDIVEIIDTEAFLPEVVVSLALWVADYYAAGQGDALLNAMPPVARREAEGAFRRVRVAHWIAGAVPALRGEKQRIAAWRSPRSRRCREPSANQVSK